jgi:serine/threonine protein kinase
MCYTAAIFEVMSYYFIGVRCMILVGQQLGHYRLVRLIGQGGMGEIYLADDTRMPRQVAVKIVRNERQPYPDAKALQQAERLFQREMKAIALLDHPYILSLHDFGEEPVANGSIVYMVMPYRPEGSLVNWLVQRGSELLAPQDVGHMIMQAASALQHAHDRSIIHQDVKPSNFLVRANADYPTRPDLFLVDFGIARVLSATSTASNSVRGTCTYMAPEQWSGDVVAATDQYALAIMTYQLLTGQLPFQGRPEQVMFQHLTVPPKPPSQLNSRLSPAVDAVILHALAKNADERFPTIKIFAVALQQAFDYVDLRATLSITREEALQGASRTITLPSKQRVTVTIPPNVQHGQVLHLPDQGMSYYDGGPRGSLQLTLSAAQTDSMPRLVNADKQDLPTVATSSELPPTVVASDKLGKQLSLISDTNVPQPRTDEPVSATPMVRSTSLESGAISPDSNVVESPSGTIPPLYQDPPMLLESDTTSSANNNSKPSNQHTIVIVAVVLLLIISGALATAFVNNTIATNNVHATATMQVQATIGAATAQVQATATAQAQATVTTIAANPDLYPPVGKLALIDPLSQPSSWPNYSDTSWGGQCQFVNGAYQVSQSQTNRNFFCNENIQYSNFAFEVKMTINQGDCSGLVIRSSSNGSNLYRFQVCQNGNYAFYKYTSHSANTTLVSGNSSAINQGTGQSNTIAVVANGSNVDLYVNSQKIDSASDSTYSQGIIGLDANAYNNATIVTYQDAKVWTI